MTVARSLEDLLANVSGALADVVERAGTSLVHIDGDRRPSTGVIVASDLVLTVDHLLDLEIDLHVRTSDGRVLGATLAGRDPSSDLAVLRVAGLEGHVIRPADRLPRPGELAIAVARGASGALTASFGLFAGVVDRLRTRLGPSLEQVVRVEAFSSPGFTGGALIDAQGNAIGITNAALVRGMRLAVPASHAWKVAQAIASRGSIKRGYLGIGSQPVRVPSRQRGGRADDRGLLVVAVGPDSPADRAGVLVGDIIVEFDRRVLTDPSALLRELGPERVGTSVPLTVLRGGSVQELHVTIGTRE